MVVAINNYNNMHNAYNKNHPAFYCAYYKHNNRRKTPNQIHSADDCA